MDPSPSLREPYLAEKKPNKNGCLFGCLGIFIGVPVLIVIVAYFVFMHTALPLQLLVRGLNQNKNLKIEEIGGSISRGFTIASIRYSDGSGNESVLEGVALQWGDIGKMMSNQELVIEQIGLRRAHIYVDQSNKTASTTSTTSSSSGSSSSTSTSSSGQLKLFEIKNVDVREVVIESTTGDFKLELDQLLIKGFRIRENQFDLAALSVGSNFVDLNLEDAQTVSIAGHSVPFTRRITGVFKPGMHKALTQKIDFAVELGAVAGGMVTRARGFNGAVEVVDLGSLGHEAITIKDFTPADYFSPEFSGPIRKLFMVMETREKAAEAGTHASHLDSGNFTLGSTVFTMAPQIVDKDPLKPDELSGPIIAKGLLDGMEITATLKQAPTAPFYRVGLSSTPKREPRELIALLWFGKTYGTLTPEEIATVDATEKRNFPPEK